MKPCMDVAQIPVHANVGMGVGGVPDERVQLPVDAVSRCSRACVDILKVDGLSVGSGDIFGMPVAHAVASGMNGLRAAGDLVARLGWRRACSFQPEKEANGRWPQRSARASPTSPTRS